MYYLVRAVLVLFPDVKGYKYAVRIVESLMGNS